MAKKRKVKKLTPPENQVEVKLKQDKSTTTWPDYIPPMSVPYVSHVPKNPIQMSEKRKKRIRSVMWWHNKGKSIKWIAEKLDCAPKTVKRDLTTAVELTNKAMPYVPKLEKSIMREVKTSITKAQDLFERVETTIDKLEEEEKHTDNPKMIMAYSMLIGELRQSLELGAKLSGELQSGTRVNVLVFSDLVKKIIRILESELDRDKFLRIRDRIKLEMRGETPLGARGGEVQVEDVIAEE